MVAVAHALVARQGRDYIRTPVFAKRTTYALLKPCVRPSSGLGPTRSQAKECTMTWVLVILLAFHLADSHPFSFIIRDGQVSQSNTPILLTHGSPRSFPPTSSLGSLFSLPLFSQLRNPSLGRSFEFDPTGPSVYPSVVQEPNPNQALRATTRQIAFTTPIPIKTEKMVLPKTDGSTFKSVSPPATLYREDTNVHNYLKKKKKPEVL